MFATGDETSDSVTAINDDHETNSPATERRLKQLDLPIMREPTPLPFHNPTRTSLLRQHVQQPQKRSLLTVPTLNFESTFSRDGIPGLMTKEGFKLGWTDYQKLLVNRLNDLLAGEPYADLSPKDLALMFARDPMSASIFNHASMAHNNQFFFDGFSTSPQSLDKCPSVKESLENTFGSIETLRTTMLDTASAMFGPGFVWLVWIKPPASASYSTGNYRILTTYIAGTPYPEAGYRQQGLDMASNNASSFDAYQASQQRPAQTLGSFGRHSESGKKNASYPPGGTQVTPVLCVNTWEHVYIYDFGLVGKRRYLADWWDCIDWHRVEQNTPRDATPMKFR